MICQLSKSILIIIILIIIVVMEIIIIIIILIILILIIIIILIIVIIIIILIIIMIRSNWSRTLHRVLVKLLFCNTRAVGLWIGSRNRYNISDGYDNVVDGDGYGDYDDDSAIQGRWGCV